jgi:trimethylamine:corrinoid methyltransferase-like protein
LDVIHAVGPRGHYLRERHTRDYFHKMDLSEVVHVPDQDGSYRDPFDMARQKTDWILESHHPEPLSESQRAELASILESAENELS